ncbi:MAG TPA: hypothetical protein VJ853_08395 [Thermoanaerobaculia bacterium]|nr:hypothetical protein [Thermoanaerobaculia bacterium]
MSSKRLDVAIVVAVALLSNFAYLKFSNGDYYFPDSFTYLTPARAMLHGAGFVDALGRPETLRTPAYPLLLAAFGAHAVPVLVFQHLLNIALAVAIYFFVMSRAASRLAALAGALYFAMDPPTVHYANKVLTETLFTVFLFVLFIAALQKRAIASGVLIGVLILIRPIALFFWIPLFAIWPRKWGQMAALVALSLALPLAWAARNRIETGAFTVSPIGTFNLLEHRAAAALAIEDGGDDFKKDLADEQKGLEDDVNATMQDALQVDRPERLPPSTRARFYTRPALRVLAQHPVAVVEMSVRGTFINLFDSDWDAIADVTTISPEVVKWGLNAVPVIVFVLAIVGTIGAWRTHRALAILLVITVGYFVVISSGSEAEARFRVPVVPQLAIAAALGVDAIRRGVKSEASGQKAEV